MTGIVTPAPGIHPWGTNGAENSISSPLPLGVALIWTPPLEKPAKL